MSKHIQKTEKRADSTYVFHDVGFHGDKHLIDVIDYMFLNENIQCFVETGTNVGTTLAYVARKYPSVQCYSCEPDKEAYAFAVKNTDGLDNVKIYNLMAQEFLLTLESNESDFFQKSTLFWLDAHGYGFTWPLKEEVAFVTGKMSKAYMFIDDFQVPGCELFGYDSYQGQVCSYEFIHDSLKRNDYPLYYPNYSDRTSEHHPLRGWGLFTIGVQLTLPDELKGKVKRS